MKKIVLSLAGALAVTTFAPEASALPVFARQVGMACNACHYQHYPLLNAFGRAFKSNAYTTVGAQPLVEGEGLSIPDRLNLGVYATAGVTTQSAASGTTGVAGTETGNNLIFTPGTGGELSLFIGGRVSDFAGFIGEAGLGGSGQVTAPAAGTAVPTGGLVGASKLLFLFPVGDSRVGLSVHSSNDQGVAYSFETLNTGAAGTHKLMGNKGPSNQHLNATSAAQYLNTATAATGVSVIANNSTGFVNVGLWEMAGNEGVTGANALTLNYARGVYTTDLGSFDASFGIQHFGGQSTVTSAKPDANIIDFQAQADDLGIYASYGTAAAGDASGATTNPFNGDTVNTKSALNVAATYVVAKGATVQGGLRFGKQYGYTDNAIMVGATYELAQNIGLSLNYTTQSGSYWDTLATSAVGGAADNTGKTATTLLLETLF
jgi:hypothetical protein